MKAAPTKQQQGEPIVYVIDDDASVRAALEDLLTSVELRVSSFSSTQAFLDQARPEAPACLVLDIRMPGQSGLDFQRGLATRNVHIPIIFITGHGDIEMSVRAMKEGAIEFLTKPFRDQELLDAVQRGLQIDQQQRTEHQLLAELHSRWQTLSQGEQEVMRLVVNGFLNKQIAGQLGVSEITVKVRRAQVMRKMRVQNLAGLIRIWDKIKPAAD
ncbi:response regulator transcription factor [Oryzifoliimicrobium ureilyticus]|uniref:response regulator transcription factor n=1 Tax=Oryzifoliimicrobium ureilyticus TaxID=3113724 RepID=UPI003076730D